MFKKYVVKQGVTTLTVNLDTWDATVEREEYADPNKKVATHELAYWVSSDWAESDADHEEVENQGTFIGVLDRNMGPFAVACLESVLECVQWSDMDHLILGGNRSGTIAYVE